LTAIPWTYQEIQAELARRSLAEFVRQSWHVIEPGTPLKWGWALDAICDHVQALVENRLGKQNLVANVPPGSMKSTIVSVCLPAWIWIQDHARKPGLGPGWRGIFTSGSDEIAQRDSLRCRDIVVGEWYQNAFKPDWELTKDQNTKHLFKNTMGGWRRAMSAGARITGSRGDALIVDDPNDAQEIYSRAHRESIITWWDQAAVNRLNDLAVGKRILIQQRLHEDDLTGHVTRKNRAIWDCLVIRQEYENPKPDDLDCIPTGLCWADPRRSEGELFFPDRFPLSVVDEEKVAKGPSGYAGQHQQRPAPASGLIFKTGFVQTFHPAHHPKYSRVVISLDTAFKDGEENDYSVATVWGEWDAGFDCLARWKDKVGFPSLKTEVKALADAWRPHGLSAILVEDKASGQSLIQELKQSTTLPIVAIKVDRDKIARAHAVVPLWEAGKVRVPDGAAWVRDFLDQLYGFPRQAHDDDVDSMTQALNYLNLGWKPEQIDMTGFEPLPIMSKWN
jgi:predicted phage terminase large subunit-like protein